MDYSKGLLRRLSAFEHFLRGYPAFRGFVHWLQIAPASRSELKAYGDFREAFELGAADINGRYGDIDWTPVRYLSRPLSRSKLAGLYRASAIGLVTPMRDGMNLVAKEYVAAQDPADPGVLVLSQFAGAAVQMKAALIVNPYDPDEVADAIHTGLDMPLVERQRRHAELIEGLRREDAKGWADQFVNAIAG
jgi:trehalose 6-phosphate synthase